MVFLMSLVRSRSTTRKQQKIDWVSDASDLLELQFIILMQARLSYLVPRKTNRGSKSVVRYDASNSIAYIIIGLRDDPQHFYL